MMTRMSWPRRSKALGKAPATSARPPTLTKGATSAAQKRIFNGALLCRRGRPTEHATGIRDPGQNGFTAGHDGRVAIVGRTGACVDHAVAADPSPGRDLRALPNNADARIEPLRLESIHDTRLAETHDRTIAD